MVRWSNASWQWGFRRANGHISPTSSPIGAVFRCVDRPRLWVSRPEASPPSWSAESPSTSGSTATIVGARALARGLATTADCRAGRADEPPAHLHGASGSCDRASDEVCIPEGLIRNRTPPLPRGGDTHLRDTARRCRQRRTRAPLPFLDGCVPSCRRGSDARERGLLDPSGGHRPPSAHERLSAAYRPLDVRDGRGGLMACATSPKQTAPQIRVRTMSPVPRSRSRGGACQRVRRAGWRG